MSNEQNEKASRALWFRAAALLLAFIIVPSAFAAELTDAEKEAKFEHLEIGGQSVITPAIPADLEKHTLVIPGATQFTNAPPSQKVTFPIAQGTVTFDQNALTVVNITIVTNVNVTIQYVTNVFNTTFTGTSPLVTTIFDNVIDPSRGPRQVKTIIEPTALSLAPFANTNWATVYLSNPRRFPVTWPSTNQVRYRPAPPAPTDDFPIVFFESINGQMIGSQ